MLFLVEVGWVRLLLLAIALAVTLYLLRLPVRPDDEPAKE